ncbi:IclR family transcriptional regulator [Alloalcanivorax gelatiniphagus]
MKNTQRYIAPKPAYAIDSVDHALRLALLLQQEGSIRVTDAAARLEVSRSTAHRLLAMLVYRDFAEQADDRSYHAGPALRQVQQSGAPLGVLRRLARPHMQALTTKMSESTNLMVLAGTETRFILTVEADQILRVGDRGGRALPAHLVSGGKVLLADMGRESVLALYEEADDVDLAALLRELNLVRKRGFAINNQLTEKGVTAIGVPIRDHDGVVCSALSVALPSARFERSDLPSWLEALNACATAITADLATAESDAE